MFVLMMSVVNMEMFVLHGFMTVKVVVFLGEVKEDTGGHECCSQPKQGGWELPGQTQCDGTPQKGGCGKVSSCSRRAQMAERQYKTNET